MIEPTIDDIGRKVVYREKGTHKGRRVEEGVITSFNIDCVFVRYRAGVTARISEATSREDLEWATPRN